MVTELSEVTIRPAEPADASAIAAVHVASWRGAYAGIVPDAYLASLDVGQREKHWVESLTATGSHTWLADADGRTIGFATLGPSRDEDAEPRDLEIYAIYLDPESWGRGVARDLMRTLLAEVRPGVTVTLWVLADATRARHFYRRHGFAPDGVERRDDIGGTDLTMVRYRRD
ncbi:GNAT family N-acetyltransferase [Cellulosimicrobium arenosum]|uniref:GNAT family N-acetyltransferase n=1 Tax=Cellulosimicrobium arenosum TaxID=2708133 RepID=A0A927PGA9_9MICO|nr:GNAT family N-acetyltransferase [Cellulosimicrobium arenosum]MBD8080658.1 GNAT family N-acetyltransferase [Cellulosimicrobium arenosum]